MRREEYDELRSRLESEYRDKIAKLKAEHEERIRALVLLRPVLTNGNGSAAGNGDSEHGDVMNLVRNALATMSGGEFNVASIERMIGDAGAATPKRSSISRALRRLADEGCLNIEEQGQGRRPTRYRAKSADN